MQSTTMSTATTRPTTELPRTKSTRTTNPVLTLLGAGKALAAGTRGVRTLRARSSRCSALGP
jgi:hypothetical protein